MTPTIDIPAEGSRAEHQAVLDLVELSDVTHTAINDGDWTDPNTWEGGRIPGDDARVQIAEGVTVTYDSQSDASIFTVRVDGDLEFATDQDTNLLVDTLVVTSTGKLEIGTEENPLDPEFSADIVIANNGDIDVSWDPQLLSRGIVSLGEVKISGHNPLTHSKVSVDPLAGDNTLTLENEEIVWQVGDTLVVAGTHKQGFDATDGGRVDSDDYLGTQDEEVTITAINGNEITFDPPLVYDHDTPAADLKTVVTNQSRNITISSEDGPDTPVHQRGHVTVLHNDDVDIRYVELTDLGRTDKSEVSDHVDDIGRVRSDSNIQSRDPLTIRDTGLTDVDNPIDIVAVAVNGSPGFGIVQDNANAHFAYNTVYDVFGASFVSASQADLGTWHRNVAIKTEGAGFGENEARDSRDINRDDIGRNGDGFFFSSRQVDASENIAANTTHGYTYISSSQRQDISADTLDNPDVAQGADSIGGINSYIAEFRDNEAFGNQVGFISSKSNAAHGSDARNTIDNFLAWEVSSGIESFYSGHYTLTNTRIIGTDSDLPNSGPTTGVLFGNRIFDWTLNGITFENLDRAGELALFETGDVTDEVDSRLGLNVIDVEYIDVAEELTNLPIDGHQFLSSSDLVEGRLAVQYVNPLVVELGEDLNIEWIKVDSIGATQRSFQFDSPSLDFNREIVPTLRTDGYYTDQDGNKIFLFEDFATDRGTGEVLKIVTPVTLNLTDAQLNRLRAVDNGDIELGGPAPDAASDRARTAQDEDISIDVLANDSDADGGRVWVDGLIQPTFGEVTLNDDGTVLYKPDFHFEGTDQFSYWLRDEEGNISRGEVSVRVGPGGIPEPEVLPRLPADADLAEAVATNFAPISTRHFLEVDAGGTAERDFASFDVDPNGDDLFVTSFFLREGSDQLDLRLDEDGVVQASAVRGASNDLAQYRYTISDGRGGEDFGDLRIHTDHRHQRDFSIDRNGLGLDDVPEFSVSLVNANTDTIVGDLEHLGSYSLADFGSDGLNFLVESPDYNIGSVTFYLNDVEIAVDNNGQFTAFGDRRGDIFGENLAAGEHYLRAVATSEDNGNGFFQFETRAIFDLVDGPVTTPTPPAPTPPAPTPPAPTPPAPTPPAPTPPAPTPPTTEVDDFRIALFEEEGVGSRIVGDLDGETVSLTSAELGALRIRTRLNEVDGVESVRFRIDGPGGREEFVDTFGNFNFGTADGLDLAEGDYTVTVTGFGAGGRRLANRQVEFTVEEEAPEVLTNFLVDISEEDDRASLLSRNPDGDDILVTPDELDSLLIRTYLARDVEGVESVRFSVNGTKVEVVDNDGNFFVRGNGLDLTTGTHTISIEGFSQDDARGDLLASREVTFTLVGENWNSAKAAEVASATALAQEPETAPEVSATIPSLADILQNLTETDAQNGVVFGSLDDQEEAITSFGSTLNDIFQNLNQTVSQNEDGSINVLPEATLSFVTDLQSLFLDENRFANGFDLVA